MENNSQQQIFKKSFNTKQETKIFLESQDFEPCLDENWEPNLNKWVHATANSECVAEIVYNSSLRTYEVTFTTVFFDPYE